MPMPRVVEFTNQTAPGIYALGLTDLATAASPLHPLAGSRLRTSDLLLQVLHHPIRGYLSSAHATAPLKESVNHLLEMLMLYRNAGLSHPRDISRSFVGQDVEFRRDHQSGR
jgi:hypothetical protein